MKPPLKKPLAEWVNRAREHRGIRVFAELTGLSIGQISKLETGQTENPTLDTLERIAAASEGRCNCPVLTINR